ncbi:MAG: 7-carboxy-7-deazaguanine synthase QueE [Methylococcales bacterium]|jgi:7-carboxy-7-deazaguanine synthase|nr:7-carboxy-7-deazaguanine synthase QueE [Methylococcales bacterium]
MPRLKITEIFYSLQGEGKTAGIPTTFIRLTGCPLRCSYCDTTYAFQGGEMMTVDEVLSVVKRHSTQYVTVTGGEPLAQKTVIDLMVLLLENDLIVSLETSGALSLKNVPENIVKVVDVKTPSSGEEAKNLFDNFNFLSSKDQIKFVIGSQLDYEWSKKILIQYQLNSICDVLFSPVASQLSPRTLADWILQDQLFVRFQIQLHKVLWGDVPGR